MKTKAAKELFHGPEGYNCTQAILKTFQKEFFVDDAIIECSSRLGGGNAPNQICGALYACHLLVAENPELIERVNRVFLNKMGSLHCREIKRARQATCSECVQEAASILCGLFKEP